MQHEMVRNCYFFRMLFFAGILLGRGGVDWTVIDKNDDSDDEFVMGWV